MFAVKAARPLPHPGGGRKHFRPGGGGGASALEAPARDHEEERVRVTGKPGDALRLLGEVAGVAGATPYFAQSSGIPGARGELSSRKPASALLSSPCTGFARGLKIFPDLSDAGRQTSSAGPWRRGARKKNALRHVFRTRRPETLRLALGEDSATVLTGTSRVVAGQWKIIAHPSRGQRPTRRLSNRGKVGQFRTVGGLLGAEYRYPDASASARARLRPQRSRYHRLRPGGITGPPASRPMALVPFPCTNRPEPIAILG